MAELPEGTSAPPDGSLPHPDVADGFSAYVHIPFCRVRCGYCDFNTYTNVDFGPGASVGDFHESLRREIGLSAKVLSSTSKPGPLKTVFFGGGTPTMVNVQALVAVVDELRHTFGIATGAEITTEANPETVSFEYLQRLRDAGFSRISFGMQSAVPNVLTTLDRVHTQGQVERVVTWARELGLRYSLDLIYGAPGETMEQWNESLDTALALEPDHISAYALTIEPGTKMGAQLKRGEIIEPDPDELAEKYILADQLFSSQGLEWYEISNWSKPGEECRHNLHYWKNSNWWGYGPGAHSHINGTRFWNVKHPLVYAQKLRGDTHEMSPAAGREILTDAEKREEAIMMGIRLSTGIDIPEHISAHLVAGFISDGLIDPKPALNGRLILTRKGRLLADTVTRALW
ncbi:radical SAM family heme chaperone HemW [Arcanobacterium ihumii]|uniref:radical SAM family heme chaperone HemW n=1 Tax=Arcanobacterium ihumii TaxID=2138162 RepID=UPI000F53FF99|nr:radical SAM family heme chaperone HemW [Arcanobacterium ihumii]